MTLRLLKKLRTTARRITPATRAAKFATLAVLLGTAGVLAQPPGYQPLNYRMTAAQQQAAQPQNGQSYGGQPNVAPNGLTIPPGYRQRTPPPQAQPQDPVSAPGSMPGSGSGKVMYFQKPADSLTVTGADSTAGLSGGEVAQLNDPNRVQPIPVPTADVAPSVLPAPLPPPPSRYLPPGGGAADRPLTPPITRPELAAPPAVTVPVAGVGLPPVPAPVYSTQPEMQPKTDGDPPSTSKKQEVKIVPVPPQYIQIPPRERVFMVYNDAQLEKAIMDRLREDLKAEGKWTPDAEKSLVFPAMPVISPPGIAYQPKTSKYEPRKVILEPGYVVHRRLHYEEKNSERIGWDLGPASTLVSAAYFWKDTLLLPQSLASGFVYGFWDTSAGKCLPGSPSPYFLYPPGLTLSGSVFEGVVVTGAFFLLP